MKKKFSKQYYKMLCEEADELNETFKYEGLSDRAIVVSYSDGYKICILKFNPKEI